MSGVLIISRQFLPYSPSYGWTARAFCLARFLVRQGLTVHVLASRASVSNYFGYQKEVQELSVHYLNDPYLERYYQSSGAPPGLLQRLGNLIVPDRALLLAPAYFAVARNLIDKYQLTTLISTAPPHSSLLTGLALKKWYGKELHWVVDYRDSWNSNPHFRNQNRWAQRLNQWMECRVLDACDSFCYASPPMLNKIGHFYPKDLRSKSRLVMSGYQGAPHGPPIARAGPLRIGYFGSMKSSLGYGVGPLFECLRRSPQRVEVHLFGSHDFTTPDLPVQVHDWLDHGAARAKMREMDYLLYAYANVGNSDEVVTGKLFDYLWARRPILCLTPPDNYGSNLVAELGVGVHADIHSLPEVDALLNQLSPEHCQSLLKTCESVDLERFSSDSQFAGFLPLS